jgi:hypothetical protein
MMSSGRNSRWRIGDKLPSVAVRNEMSVSTEICRVATGAAGTKANKLPELTSPSQSLSSPS